MSGWTKIDYADQNTWPKEGRIFDFLRCFPGLEPGTWIWALLHGYAVNTDSSGFSVKAASKHSFSEEREAGWPEVPEEWADWWRDADTR